MKGLSTSVGCSDCDVHSRVIRRLWSEALERRYWAEQSFLSDDRLLIDSSDGCGQNIFASQVDSFFQCRWLKNKGSVGTLMRMGPVSLCRLKGKEVHK